jgi:hypothetical protein
MEEVKFIEKNQLLINSSKLCMSAYEQYYHCVSLHKELVKQYQVDDDDDLKHLLLSLRAFYDGRGYECCETCNRSLLATKKESDEYIPPKYAIANGSAFGHIPQTKSFTGRNGKHHVRQIDAEMDLDDLICVAISPLIPFGYVHTYTAQSQNQ